MTILSVTGRPARRCRRRQRRATVVGAVRRPAGGHIASRCPRRPAFAVVLADHLIACHALSSPRSGSWMGQYPKEFCNVLITLRNGTSADGQMTSTGGSVPTTGRRDACCSVATTGRRDAAAQSSRLVAAMLLLSPYDRSP